MVVFANGAMDTVFEDKLMGFTGVSTATAVTNENAIVVLELVVVDELTPIERGVIVISV